MADKERSPEWAPERVRLLRRDLKHSRHEMSALLGVTERTIYRWEHGQAEPRLKMIRRLEEIERDLTAAQAQPQRLKPLKDYEKNRTRFEELQARFQETVKKVEQILKTLQQTASGPYQG